MTLDKTLAFAGQQEIRGGSVAVAGKPSLEVGEERVLIGRDPACSVVLDDARVSAVHVELRATERGVHLRDMGSTNGTFIGGVQVIEGVLREPTQIRCGDTTIEFRPTAPRSVRMPGRDSFGRLVGAGPTMRAIFEMLERAAPTSLSVLILGETGTGKEVAANAIHMASPRAGKPFVVVDCGAIPSTLAESTLFGHEKGAFTGAVARRLSPFLQAEGGTLFLDELGELPLDLQPKLLRVLAERRVQSVGGKDYKPFDVRVLAATRRDLVREVNSGTFRSDLYFRIAQVRVELPPLRERLDDLPLLVENMTRAFATPADFERITDASLERLMAYDWPGNVRELENVLRTAIGLTPSGPIDLTEHLFPLAGAAQKAAGTSSRLPSWSEALAKYEQTYLTTLVAEVGSSISALARRAGVQRVTLRAMLRRNGITREGGDDDE